jgi:hypothetical protein
MVLLVTPCMGLMTTIPTYAATSGVHNPHECYFSLHRASTPSSTARTAA